MGQAERIRELVEPLLATTGLECWDVELAAGVVRVLVDRPGGVDLDALGAVTQLISDALDDHDVDPGGHYLLEVSSPGVERTLRTPAQYRRFVGTVVAVKTAVAFDGERRFRGVLLDADDEGITLGPEPGPPPAGRPDPAAEEPAGRRLAYDDIQRTHTVLVWGPAPKPGSPGRGGRSGRAHARAAAAPAPMKDTAS
jgi:ribosome maturation factor RimP